ncbi:uncharacterized protein TNCV_522381 [Trichonephila clavipes]|nr:uncharacterized protein TNCV_522381 [Trichonephila clavipes]
MSHMSHFSTRQCSVTHGKDVTRLSSHCNYRFLAYPIARFVSNRAYSGSFGTGSRAFHECDQTISKGKQIWNEMSQDIIQNLYASMPDGIASCIRARGGSTGH